MKTDTANRIIEYIVTNTQARPHDIVKMLGMSHVAVHKQLRKLVKGGKLQRQGKPPLVFYTQGGRQNTIDQIKDKIVPILKEEGVKRSFLFGSYVRGEQTNNSDLDILVDYPKNKSLFDFIHLKHRLEDTLQKKVDLVEYDSIKPRLKQYILPEQIQIL